MVELCNGGKPPHEIMAEYDLGRLTLRRRVNAVNATGSSRAADNRTPPRAGAHHRARARERAPQDGGRYFKTGSADVRTKVAVITANAGRSISTQCEVLGVPRPAYCSMRGRGEKPKQPDPLTPEVALAYEANRRAYGARKINTVLERHGFCASRRRVGRIMRGNGLVSAYPKAKFRAHADKPDEAELPT